MGTTVFLGIISPITPPVVSMPRERGVTCGEGIYIYVCVGVGVDA